MKYSKGTFVIIPNRDFLDGKPPAYQAVFFWLCRYADEDGVCFPSRERLASHLDMDERTITRYIAKMVEDGLITKTKRRKTGEVKNNSNLYQINIIQKEQDISAEQQDKSCIKQRDKNVCVTVSSINSIQRTVVPNESKEDSSVTEPDIISELKRDQLPIQRGTRPIQRVVSIYSDLYRYLYGILPKLKMAVVGASIDKLLESYSEIQIAALMVIFFNWYGMNGDSEFEYKKLLDATFPFAWFYSSINKYEIYLRNVYKLEFDDIEKTRDFVGKSMNNLIR